MLFPWLFVGMQLDGCFIGAFTTAEEDLILATLVLELGVKGGVRPSVKAKRRLSVDQCESCINYAN